MKKIIMLCLISTLLSTVFAQDYTVHSIPDSLFKGANAVVRYSECLFIQNDLKTGVSKHVKIITILNESGNSDGDIQIQQDKYSELKSFSGQIYDASTGKLLKKIGKADLNNYIYSEAISSDDKYSYYDFHAATYPVTIRYEYEMKYKNGISYYLSFHPTPNWGVSVQSAKHIVQLPKGMKLRSKTNLIANSEGVDFGAYTEYQWEVKNLKFKTEEPFSPPLSELAPVALLAPEKFCMDNYYGDMSTWNTLGLWEYGLQEGRGELPIDVKEKVRELLTDVTDPKEKARILYNYLQKSTRYVSIQLGIGGLQTMLASDVAKTGFGDCKALSNYMQALLAEVNIPSVYTGISTERVNLYENFASLNQMNHAILMVPLEQDTLWLECTNSTLPFNYVHSNIAGHQAFLIKADGGQICRVRSHADKDETESSNLKIVLDEQGNGVAYAQEQYRLAGYEKMKHFEANLSHDERANYLAKKSSLPRFKVSELNIQTQKTETPSIALNYKYTTEGFANKSGNRMFVPISPLQTHYTRGINTGKRNNPIRINSAEVQIDTISIQVPATYIAEALPKSFSIESEFGTYALATRFEDNTLYLEQRIFIKKGRYGIDKWEEFYKFLKTIDRESGKRAVFKLKE